MSSYYAAMESKTVVMKGGRCRLERPSWWSPIGQKVMRFEADEKFWITFLMVNVNRAEASVASDRSMIFDKILSYEGGVAGFNTEICTCTQNVPKNVPFYTQT